MRSGRRPRPSKKSTPAPLAELGERVPHGLEHDFRLFGQLFREIGAFLQGEPSVTFPSVNSSSTHVAHRTAPELFAREVVQFSVHG